MEIKKETLRQAQRPGFSEIYFKNGKNRSASLAGLFATVQMFLKTIMAGK